MYERQCTYRSVMSSMFTDYFAIVVSSIITEGHVTVSFHQTKVDFSK